MNDSNTLFTIEDIFTIVHNALMPFYSDTTVTVEQERDDGTSTRFQVSQLAFIMNSIGHALSPINGWTDHVDDVLRPMHSALDGRDYSTFTFTIDTPTALVSYSRKHQ